MNPDVSHLSGLPSLRDSEMAARVRAFDWSATDLGPIDGWPNSLKVAVGICLNSRFPMFVWWGPRLVNIHNDAYIPVLGGRHPTALGMSARDIWAEIWPVIGEDVDRVLRGDAVSKERVRLLLERNGYPEETYFTYSHSPIPDDDGGIGGLFQVCTDETAIVLAERERAVLQAQRRRADERAFSILESTTDAYFALDHDWCIQYVNPPAEHLIGRARDELLGKNLWTEFPGLAGSEFEVMYRRSMSERVAGSVVSYYPDDDRWYEVHSYPTPDGLSLYFRDVSERKRAENVQRELTERHANQSRKFDQVLSSITDFAYTFDLDGRFTFVNKPLLDLWGLPLEQAVGKNFFDLHYPDALAATLQAQIRQVIATKQRVVDETPYTSPSGQPGFYQYILTPVIDAQGNVEAVAGSTRDITEAKRVVAARDDSARTLEAERANLAAMIERAPAFICTLRGPDHVFEIANDRYDELVGRRPLIGKTVREALPEVVDQGFVELLDTVYRTGAPFAGDEVPVLLQIGSDGALEIRYINFVYQAMRDASGAVTGIFVHGIDVTNLVQSRESTRISEERYRKLFESMDEGFCVIEVIFDAREKPVDYRFIEVNPAFRAQTGLADALGRSVLEMGLVLEPHWFEKYGRVAVTGEPIRFVDEAKNLAGRWYEVHAFRIGGADSRRVAVLFNDISGRQIAEQEREQLLESERAARSDAERAGRMKDEFLATLSHELRTPLSAVLGWATILKTKPPTPEMLEQGLTVIERNARMQAQLVTDLLDMSRIISGKMRLDVQVVDLRGVVEAALDSVRPAAEAKGIAIHRMLPRDLGTLHGDPARLQQVVWNLLSNSVKFTPRDGRIDVVLTLVDDQIELSVRDTGKGIEPRFLAHVFERFRQADSSSTRQHGGLGLGLAIVQQLVELHGGSVGVTSDGEGRGTTFTVRLPLAASLRSTSETVRIDRKSLRLPLDRVEPPNLAGVRVLVVDDERDARDLAKRLLEEAGAEVVVAASADEAFMRVGTGRFDVILSDIGLPVKDGYAFVRELRERGNRVPAAALTAFARAEDRARALGAGYQAHLTKPIEAADLLATVATLARGGDSRV